MIQKTGCVWIAFWLIFTAMSWAGEKPLWEVGFGVAGMHVPDYRGSDAYRGYLLPVPYVMYRGKWLRAEGSRLKGRIFESDRLHLDISLGGGVPVNSARNAARSGMPDLDPTGELGPSLEVNLWREVHEKQSLWLKLPWRGVFSLSLSDPAYQGWTFSPYLQYAWRTDVFPKKWDFSLSVGPIFADETYHAYFYEVTPGRATPQRAEYHPQGGYSGSRMTFTVRKRYENFWVGGFVRYDTLAHAVFADSPLVKTEQYVAVGIGVAWVSLTSRTRVRTDTQDPP